MAHPDTWTEGKKQAVDRLRKYSLLLMTSSSNTEVAIEKWEVVRQSLGHVYFGRDVEKAYRLSWRAIEPHVPGPGEALVESDREYDTIVSNLVKSGMIEPEVESEPSPE